MAKVDKVDKVDKSDRVDKVDKVDNVDKMDKVDKMNKVDKVDNVRMDLLEKVHKVDEVDKVHKVDKVDIRQWLIARCPISSATNRPTLVDSISTPLNKDLCFLTGTAPHILTIVLIGYKKCLMISEDNIVTVPVNASWPV